MAFTNENRTRYYGLRVGDIVNARSINNEVIGGCKVLELIPMDNNRVLIEDKKGNSIEWVAEWCEIVTKVEDIKPDNTEKEIWKVGENFSYIVSNVKPERKSYDQHDWESEKGYYGGYLIAESIPDEKKSKLMAAAPELLEVALKAHELTNRLIHSTNEELRQLRKLAELAIKKATE